MELRGAEMRIQPRELTCRRQKPPVREISRDYGLLAGAIPAYKAITTGGRALALSRCERFVWTAFRAIVLFSEEAISYRGCEAVRAFRTRLSRRQTVDLPRKRQGNLIPCSAAT